MKFQVYILTFPLYIKYIILCRKSFKYYLRKYYFGNGDTRQLVKCLPSMHKALAQSPLPDKPGVMVHNSNLSTGKVE